MFSDLCRQFRGFVRVEDDEWRDVGEQAEPHRQRQVFVTGADIGDRSTDSIRSGLQQRFGDLDVRVQFVVLEISVVVR